MHQDLRNAGAVIAAEEDTVQPKLDEVEPSMFSGCMLVDSSVHPRAERDIFRNLPVPKIRPGIVTFTA
jgi:hypothetical protein